MCVPLTAVADNLVECDEDFTVILDLISSGTSLSLGNNSTAVTLSDSDGMVYHLDMTESEIIFSLTFCSCFLCTIYYGNRH